MPDDPDLTAIRARRIAEMQSQSDSNMTSDNETERQRQLMAQKKHEEQVRAEILARILNGEALSRIAIVKPERARALEDLIINAARNGQIRGSSAQGQLTEADLVGLLGKLNDHEMGQESKIKFQRRVNIDEDDF